MKHTNLTQSLWGQHNSTAKSDKDIAKKETNISIPHKHRHKNS